MDMFSKKLGLGDLVTLAQEKKLTAKGQFANAIEDSVLSRHDHKILWNEKPKTPKTLAETPYEKIYDLWTKFVDRLEINYDLDKKKLDALVDMETITSGMIETLDDEDDRPVKVEVKKKDEVPTTKTVHIKILLTETDNFEFFECQSLTEPKGTLEAEAVEKDNDDYEYLTVGAGRNRRTSEAETQTIDVVVKSRSVNTKQVHQKTQSSFVSNYDMYDTYVDLERSTKEIDTDKNTKLEITTYSNEGLLNSVDAIVSNPVFKYSSMVLQRLLAGNVFRDEQKRFRSMYLPDPLDTNIKYLYSSRLLWIFKTLKVFGKAVSSMDWCSANTDILAVGYGVNGFVASKERRTGSVCVWNIKNPVNPERYYKFDMPVTAVAFSAETPQLLAVGMYDGSVCVLDVIDDATTPVAKTERATSPSFAPVWKVQWNKYGTGSEQILSASQDGRIMRYNLASGPHLIGYNQFRLLRVHGYIEGIKIAKKKHVLQPADSHPQAICLTIDPTDKEVFYVGTDEGCVNKCTLNYSFHRSSIIQAHDGGVYSLQFSPFCPKYYLTCGNDWRIRFWEVDNIEPILEFVCPDEAIECARWSPLHSCICVSCTKTAIQIWDIRKKNLKPAAIHKFQNAGVPLTLVRFSVDGRCLVVGDEEGSVFMAALEDMPIPPYYQTDELEEALRKKGNEESDEALDTNNKIN